MTVCSLSCKFKQVKHLHRHTCLKLSLSLAKYAPTSAFLSHRRQRNLEHRIVLLALFLVKSSRRCLSPDRCLPIRLGLFRADGPTAFHPHLLLLVHFGWFPREKVDLSTVIFTTSLFSLGKKHGDGPWVTGRYCGTFWPLHSFSTEFSIKSNWITFE